MKKPNKTAIVAAATFSLGLGLTQETEAVMFVSFSQSGSDVILNVSGSLDLSGLDNEQNNGINFGANDQFNTNGQLQIGAGSNVPLNKWTLTQISTPVSIGTNIDGFVLSWDGANNAGAIRFQQNNGQIAVDDAFGTQGGDTLGTTVNVTSQHAFVGKTLADFGLTVGTNVLWMENESSVVQGDDGKVFLVVAVPEPSSTALLGLGGLALMLRRRR